MEGGIENEARSDILENGHDSLFTFQYCADIYFLLNVCFPTVNLKLAFSNNYSHKVCESTITIGVINYRAYLNSMHSHISSQGPI